MMNILSTKKLKNTLVTEALKLGFRVMAHDFIEIKLLNGLQEARAITKTHEHIIFTSANAVKAYQKNIDKHGLSIAPKKLHCLQGETLAAAARLQNVEILGRAKNAQELALVILQQHDIEKVSFFCGNKRSDVLPRLLRQHNIVVDEIVLYHTVLVNHNILEGYEGILFFSPSAVESFFQRNNLPRQIPCFCIGDTTKNALRRFADNEAIVAETCSQEAVMRALLEKMLHTTTQRARFLAARMSTRCAVVCNKKQYYGQYFFLTPIQNTSTIFSMFLQKRHRTLRQSPAIRDMVAQTHLSVHDFIVPLFILEGQNIKEEIPSMPDYYRMSLDNTVALVKELWALGLKSVLLFVKCEDHLKDNKGTEALNPNGLMQRSIAAIKNAVPEMCVMTDVALDPFSMHGHDGIVENNHIVNDATVAVLAQMSVSHAQAGADFVAPSDMMDGRVGAIRNALEARSFSNTGIMSYSAKYASCFYGPFRDALDSAPGFGDKKTYQMDIRNGKEALAEALADIQEGADIIMVKPGLPYLDIVQQLSTMVQVPISVYQVSGEYAMIKAAAQRGWLNEENAIIESLTAIKRAGASLIASYFAIQMAQILHR